MCSRKTILFLFLVVSLAFAGCGKKANPQPPDESYYRGRPLKTALGPSHESQGGYTKGMIQGEIDLRRPS